MWEEEEDDDDDEEKEEEEEDEEVEGSIAGARLLTISELFFLSPLTITLSLSLSSLLSLI